MRGGWLGNVDVLWGRRAPPRVWRVLGLLSRGPFSCLLRPRGPNWDHSRGDARRADMPASLGVRSWCSRRVEGRIGTIRVGTTEGRLPGWTGRRPSGTAGRTGLLQVELQVLADGLREHA